MSDERLARILSAAYQCFTRHGMRRTTMDDIATAAGMSRPAVYQHVRNKNDAYRRLAAGLFEQALAEARAAAGDGPLPDRLHRVLSTKLELTLRLWRDSPHAAELLDASTRLTGDLVADYTAAMVDLIAATVRPETDEKTARDVAELLIALTRGLEADLTDPDLPRQRLRQGVTLLVAGLLPPSGATR